MDTVFTPIPVILPLVSSAIRTTPFQSPNPHITPSSDPAVLIVNPSSIVINGFDSNCSNEPSSQSPSKSTPRRTLSASSHRRSLSFRPLSPIRLLDLSEVTHQQRSELILSNTTALPAQFVPYIEVRGGQELVWDFLLLESVLLHPKVEIIKSVPFGARRRLAIEYSRLLNAVVQNPNIPLTYTELFLFPRAVLRPLPWSTLSKLSRKKRRHAQLLFTLTNLDHWSAGGHQRDDLITSILNLPTSRPPRKNDTQEINQRRCESFARQNGQFRKAIQSLNSYGMAPDCPSTTNILRDLHPVGAEVTTLVDFPSGIEIDLNNDDEIADFVLILHSFDKGTASGRSGLSINHLIEFSSSQLAVPELIKNLIAFSNLFLSGKALPSFAPYMSSGSLFPPFKKNGIHIRPIVCGEILRRIISKKCVKSVSLWTSKHFSPIQLGVGTSNGAETIIHSFNTFIRDYNSCDNETVIALVDFVNAFNNINRQKILHEVLLHLPKIYGWVQYTYGCGAKLFSGSNIIMASTGVQQGDPLASLLFGLVIQPLLIHIKTNIDPSIKLAAFLDDVTMAGNACSIKQALNYLVSEGPSSGLFINFERNKSILWSPRGFDQSLQFPEFFFSCDEGVELLGSAVSESPDFMAKIARKRVNKCCETLHRLLKIKDPQLCLMLLRACEGMTKLMYCWRTMPPDSIRQLAIDFRLELFEALRTITVAQGPHFGNFQFDLCSLPIHASGLGIHCPLDLLSFAYSASYLSSLRHQQHILDFTIPTNSTISALVIPPLVIAQLDDFTNNTTIDGNPIARQELFDKILNQGTQPIDHMLPHHNLQNFMARVFYDSKRSRLLSHSYITAKEPRTQRRFLTILESNASFGASSWLLALPNGGMQQRMTPLEFQAAISYRLLMPQFSQQSKCFQNKCVSVMDIYGFHGLVCRGHLLPRHNLVRDALFDLCLKAQFAPIKDAPVTCLGTNHNGQLTAFRPADLQISGDDFSYNCVDITVVSPIKSHHDQTEVGKCVEIAELAKFNKHSVSCEQAGYGFEAFAIDVFGVMAKKSYKLLQRIISSYSRMTAFPIYKASAICLRRISFAVQLGVARQAIRCRKFIDDNDISLCV